MTTLLLELPDELAGQLNSLATKEGKPLEGYAVGALIDHARQSSYAFVPEPPVITEGSLEEDSALEAAINGSFHAFDADEAHRKISRLHH